ncbi:hypothetical protein EG68_04918 [Paragonimus skrjabini miyazakii]|uniref:Carboxylesterase type B domain-containing protein n=1 Tax=Paragonimus skrjabini miyazakii TaxID=59628 RepID=A0A8S9Z4J8_9TREM|nr:hypothetical protein EG68_04918 [Paragonimus skrjabini miyazakii]
MGWLSAFLFQVFLILHSNAHSNFTHVPYSNTIPLMAEDVVVTIPKPGFGAFVGYSISIDAERMLPVHTQLSDHPLQETILVNSFLGIPYAAPPVGARRFRLPTPAYLNTKFPWYAKKYRPACMHTVDIEFLYPNFTDFNEDCLYLNIFYPNSTREDPKTRYPVLFHVHGGSFVGGSSHMYPGHLLASMGLVVVTFNYRLGPFGFLSTGDSASVGNYGLWDQLFALRWVKENIQWFHGDPSQITLMGESAGGASVGLLTVSPRSRDQDLFHRAIIMSGSDLSPWAMSDPKAINTGHYAIELGRRLGCPATRGLALSLSQVSALGESWKPVPIRPGEFGHSSVSLRQSVPYYTQVDTDALMDCLRHSYTAQEIVDVSKSLDPFRGATSFIWTPVVDGPTGFLPRMPLEERKLGHFSKIPLLAGLVHDESSFPFMGKLEEYEGRNLSVSEFTDVVARRTIGNFLNGENAYRFNVTAEELYTRYTWWSNLANNSARWERMVAMLSDHDVNAPLESIVRFHAAYSPSVYLYEFAYVSPKDPDAFAGVYHGSEQVFLLGCPFMSESFWTRVFDGQLTPAHAHRTFVHPYDHKISSFVMNLWTNFIKYGQVFANLEQSSNLFSRINTLYI